jgi:hypothetical protein
MILNDVKKPKVMTMNNATKQGWQLWMTPCDKISNTMTMNNSIIEHHDNEHYNNNVMMTNDEQNWTW